MLFLKVFGAIVTFLLTLKIAKTFGVSDSGVYFFIISTLSFISSFSMLGLNGAALKKFSLKDESKYLMSDFMILNLFSSLGFIFFIYMVFIISKSVGFSHEILSEYVTYLLVLIFPFACIQIQSSIYQARLKTTFSALYTNLGYQSLLLLYLFFYDSDDIKNILFFLTISLYVMISVFFVCNFKEIKISPSKAIYRHRRILSLSIPMMGAQVISQVNNFASHFLLSIFSSTSDISLYSVCIRIAVLISFVSTSVSRVCAPKFASYYACGDHDSLKLIVKQSSRLLFFCSFILFVIVVLFGKVLLSLFGEDFVIAYPYLIILSLGQFFSGALGNVYYLLQMTGGEKLILKVIFLSTGISLIIGIGIVPFYGILGASLMALVTLVINSVYCSIVVYKNLNINPLAIL